MGSLTSADSPEEDVPWEGVSVAVGPGEEDEWFSVVGSVRMLVRDVPEDAMLVVR